MNTHPLHTLIDNKLEPHFYEICRYARDKNQTKLEALQKQGVCLSERNGLLEPVSQLAIERNYAAVDFLINHFNAALREAIYGYGLIGDVTQIEKLINAPTDIEEQHFLRCYAIQGLAEGKFVAEVERYLAIGSKRSDEFAEYADFMMQYQACLGYSAAGLIEPIDKLIQKQKLLNRIKTLLSYKVHALARNGKIEAAIAIIQDQYVYYHPADMVPYGSIFINQFVEGLILSGREHIIRFLLQSNFPFPDHLIKATLLIATQFGVKCTLAALPIVELKPAYKCLIVSALALSGQSLLLQHFMNAVTTEHEQAHLLNQAIYHYAYGSHIHEAKKYLEMAGINQTSVRLIVTGLLSAGLYQTAQSLFAEITLADLNTIDHDLFLIQLIKTVELHGFLNKTKALLPDGFFTNPRYPLKIYREFSMRVYGQMSIPVHYPETTPKDHRWLHIAYFTCLGHASIGEESLVIRYFDKLLKNYKFSNSGTFFPRIIRSATLSSALTYYDYFYKKAHDNDEIQNSLLDHIQRYLAERFFKSKNHLLYLLAKLDHRPPLHKCMVALASKEDLFSAKIAYIVQKAQRIATVVVEQNISYHAAKRWVEIWQIEPAIQLWLLALPSSFLQRSLPKEIIEKITGYILGIPDNAVPFFYSQYKAVMPSSFFHVIKPKEIPTEMNSAFDSRTPPR